MLRRTLLSLLLSLMAGVSFADAEIREGQQYEVLATPLATLAANKIEVVELFWYGCPHCYHFEPEIAAWLKKKPADVNFRRVPAVFDPRWVPHARAYFAAEALGVLDKFHNPLFKAIHEEEQKIFDEESLLKFAGTLDIDHAAFKDAFIGFTVDAKVKQAMQFTRESGISGVPSIIINGKYRTGAQLAGGQDKVLKVVDFLVDKERAR